MPNFDEVLKGKEASRLMKDPSKLEKLRDAPETWSRRRNGPPGATPPS